MFKKSEDIKSRIEMGAENGIGKTVLYDLLEGKEKPHNIKLYSKVVLEPGAMVGFHIHEGESETYHILSGSGVYSDNGKEIEFSEGDITFTPSGEGHSIKNTGKDDLVFTALIVLD